MKEVYFPDGISSFGDADVMTFKVENFKWEEVDEQFTLANYIAKYKLTKVRLYLLTRSIDEDDSVQQPCWTLFLRILKYPDLLLKMLIFAKGNWKLNETYL